MNVLFLTTGSLRSFRTQSIYPDLLRAFIRNGHTVYAVSAAERRSGEKTRRIEEDGSFLLRVRIGNLTKCGLLEKGISTLRIQSLYRRAINRHYRGVHFDLILYSTPPITLSGLIRSIKRRDHARTYLMLKDIFPQNAVDIGILSSSGVKGLLYRFFRRREKQMYAVSDTIGCMSQANVEYVLRHNPEIAEEKVEICPNCCEVREVHMSAGERRMLREQYRLPLDQTIFVYGGNLGKPQGISFVMDCIRSCTDREVFFLIVGDGTEFSKLETFIETERPENVRLEKSLPKEEFDRLTAACDVGLIFLDHRFTIPNFPSRILSYMQARLPVLAFTDVHTDVGRVLTEGGFGWWQESTDPVRAAEQISAISRREDLRMFGENGYAYLCSHYSAEQAYRVIMRESNS